MTSQAVPPNKKKKKRKVSCFTGRNLEDARKLLLEITSVLDEAGIDYMLDAGTLLGIVRDGELIPWDSDIDISIPEKGLAKLLEVLRRGCFRHRWISRRYYTGDFTCWENGDYRVIKVRSRRWLFFKGRLTADLYIKYRDDQSDAYYWTSMKMVSKASARYFDDFEMIEYRGRQVKVPAFYEEYLTAIYGDWRTPRKDYKAHLEDGTIIGSVSDIESK